MLGQFGFACLDVGARSLMKTSHSCDYCSCLSNPLHAHCLREIYPPLFRVYLRLSSGTPIFGFRHRGTHQVCSADVVLDLRLTAFDFKACILIPPGFSIYCFIQTEDRVRGRNTEAGFLKCLIAARSDWPKPRYPSLVRNTLQEENGESDIRFAMDSSP